MYKNHKVYLCSFADSNMCKSTFRFAKQAEYLHFKNNHNDFNINAGSKYFDNIMIYNEYSLPFQFREDFKETLFGKPIGSGSRFVKGQTRGFGFWCWKPKIILETLNQIKDGDFLVYLDIGCEFNNNYEDKFIEMLEKVEKNKIMAREIYRNGTATTKNYAKADLLAYYGLLDNEEFLNSPQTETNCIIMQKCKRTIDIINQWLNAYYEHIHLLDDTPSKIENIKDFKAFTSDQAMLGIIFYKEKCVNFQENIDIPTGSLWGGVFLVNRNRTFLTTDKNNLIKENYDGFLFTTLDILDQRKIEFQKPDEFNQYNIFKNISRNKKAQQSSFHPGYSQYNDASAILNPNVYFKDYSIFTDWEENPWWMIDLEYEYEISLIKIQNKEWTTWQDRLTKLEVLYSNDLKTWEKIDKKYFDWKNGIQILNIWTLNLIKARFIKLQIPELSCLHIKEIDIYTIDTIILNAIKK